MTFFKEKYLCHLKSTSVPMPMRKESIPPNDLVSKMAKIKILPKTPSKIQPRGFLNSFGNNSLKTPTKRMKAVASIQAKKSGEKVRPKIRFNCIFSSPKSSFFPVISMVCSKPPKYWRRPNNADKKTTIIITVMRYFCSCALKSSIPARKIKR